MVLEENIRRENIIQEIKKTMKLELDKQIIEKSDSVAMIIFPGAFLVFNFVYWSYYLMD